MPLHQTPDGLALAGAGVAEAHVPFEKTIQTQLRDTKLRIAALAVADDEEPVVLFQYFQSLLHLWVADAAGIVVQILVFRGHAPLHQRISLRHRDGGEENVADLRHHLPEEGLQPFGAGAQVVKALLAQLDVVALGHQCPGIPEGAVNIKNQTFEFQFRLPPLLPDAAGSAA